MENVLSSLQFETESEQPTNKKDTKWNLIDLRNKYDSGALLAGMGDSEGSVQDFIIKLSNVFSTIAKSRQKVIDQKLLDLVKTSLLLYLLPVVFASNFIWLFIRALAAGIFGKA